MKDVLVVNAPASGAESLVFLKTFIVVPLTIVTTVLYLGMRKNKTFEQTFNRIIGSFFVFFLLFMILYPYTSGGSGANYLHMSKDSIEALQARYPAMAHLFPLIGNWTFSLFYAASELWGTFVLSILFWQFANDIIGTADSKRFYPLMILSGNVGVLSIGLILFQISSQQGDFANTVYFTCITVLVLCGIIMGAFYWMQKRVLIHDKFLPSDKKAKKQKLKLGLMDSFRKVFTSPYIGYIAILVLCYGILINVIEATWKKQLKDYSGDTVVMLDADKGIDVRGEYTTDIDKFYTDNPTIDANGKSAKMFNKIVTQDTSALLKTLHGFEHSKLVIKTKNPEILKDISVYQGVNEQYSDQISELLSLIQNKMVAVQQTQDDIYNADRLPALKESKQAMIEANNELIKEDQAAVDAFKKRIAAGETLSDNEKIKMKTHQKEIASATLDNENIKRQIAVIDGHISADFASLSKEKQDAELESHKSKLTALLTKTTGNAKLDALMKKALVETAYNKTFDDLRKNVYSKNMAIYTIVTGCVSIVFIYASKGIIRSAGWFFSAAITPVMILFTGVLFFVFNIFGDQIVNMFNLEPGTAQMTFLYWSVIAGGFGILVSKCAKYSFFDPTKEMAFIPLDHSERTAGKAAADGVGGRLGKSGGALIQASLLFTYSLFSGVATTQDQILPILAVVLLIMGGAWLYSVGALSKLYNALVAQRAKEEKDNVKV